MEIWDECKNYKTQPPHSMELQTLIVACRHTFILGIEFHLRNPKAIKKKIIFKQQIIYKKLTKLPTQLLLLNLLICYQTFHKIPRIDVMLKIQVNEFSVQGEGGGKKKDNSWLSKTSGLKYYNVYSLCISLKLHKSWINHAFKSSIFK